MQPRDDTHACPGGCDQRVPRELLACARDWYRLPYELRANIGRTHKVNPQAHRAAVLVAIRWYGEHPRELDPK